MPSCCASSSSQSRKQVPRLVQEAKKSRSVWLELLMRKKMVEIQHQNSTAIFSVRKMLLTVTVLFFVALTLASFGVSGLATSCDKKPTLRPVPKVPRINPASLVSSNHQRSNKKHSKTGPRRFGSEWSFQFHQKSSVFLMFFSPFDCHLFLSLVVFVGESC